MKVLFKPFRLLSPDVAGPPPRICIGCCSMQHNSSAAQNKGRHWKRRVWKERKDRQLSESKCNRDGGEDTSGELGVGPSKKCT